tara:strand:- start:4793 stop:5191 length:399 start_codon:yes stop_codon:yes gene_type:complete
MQISTAQLNKGFTLLEIIIVLTIISLASTSFYLLLRQPVPEESLTDKITHLQENSLYTGLTFSFTKDSIKIYKKGEWVKFEDFDTSYVQSYEDSNGQNRQIKEDEMYLIIAPGNQTSVQKITLNNNESIEIN